MIKNFRYSSTWEDFVKAVEYLKALFTSEQARWAVGFLNEFSLYLADEVVLEEDIDTVIGNEIIFLLRWYLESDFEGKDIDEEEIRLAILSAGNEKKADEEELGELVKIVRNKLELVSDAFNIERLAVRYKMKRDTVNLKLSDFQYNICSQSLSEKGRVDFAVVNMTCKKNLKGAKQGIEALLAEYEQGKSITFICDEEDIDILIDELKEMKQKIRGERQ